MSRRALSTFNSSTLSTLRRVSIPRSHARVSESSCPTCSSRWTTASPTPPRRFMSWSSTRLAPTLERTPLHSPAVTQVPPPPPLRTSPSSAPALTKPKARVVKPRKSAITLVRLLCYRLGSYASESNPVVTPPAVLNRSRSNPVLARFTRTETDSNWSSQQRVRRHELPFGICRPTGSVRRSGRTRWSQGGD